MEPGPLDRAHTRSHLVWLLAPALLLVVSVATLTVLGLEQVRESAVVVAVFNALFCTAPKAILFWAA